jgi:glutamate 5-kinase
LIPQVSDPTVLDQLEIGDGTSPFGLGGMRSKVAAAGMAGASGIETVICDGTAEGSLGRAVAGDSVGTRFDAHTEPASGFKLWLRYAKPAKGRLVIDDGAAEQLREAGSSLLPVGIISVEGEFLAGDAVEVVTGGTVIGKGIASWTSSEMTAVKGMRTEQVAEMFPDAAGEAIHRDRFVLT